MSEHLVVLELQKRLVDDVDGTELSALEREFESWRQALKREMDSGVTRRHFDALYTLRDAIGAATDVVSTTWMRHHSGRSSGLER
ncbi:MULTISPECIES: EscE/YscE/SsaE family type III secretion system needle protein co-chaperone [unclassified Bradyrhizobium]|uniref:EscE/YscE/SsaE family type III secretion system needle protein co-chaperone n=1 Tax=unclassified Bradyrhizobium TaxID=2631580 RepID=UPI003D23D5FB